MASSRTWRDRFELGASNNEQVDPNILRQKHGRKENNNTFRKPRFNKSTSCPDDVRTNCSSSRLGLTSSTRRDRYDIGSWKEDSPTANRSVPFKDRYDIDHKTLRYDNKEMEVQREIHKKTVRFGDRHNKNVAKNSLPEKRSDNSPRNAKASTSLEERYDINLLYEC